MSASINATWWVTADICRQLSWLRHGATARSLKSFISPDTPFRHAAVMLAQADDVNVMRERAPFMAVTRMIIYFIRCLKCHRWASGLQSAPVEIYFRARPDNVWNTLHVKARRFRVWLHRKTMLKAVMAAYRQALTIHIAKLLKRWRRRWEIS